MLENTRVTTARSKVVHPGENTSINNGHCHGNKYCEHPILLIRDLLKQQQTYVLLTNKCLFGRHQHMVIELEKLKLEPIMVTNGELIKVASKLNEPTYSCYKLFRARMKDYTPK